MKAFVLVLAVLGCGALAFLYAPLPVLTGAPAHPEAPAIEAQARTYFDQIDAGRNLDRPFPAMPVRTANPTTPERAALGRLLYFDPVLSGDNDVSCAHCHHPDLGFADNRALSMGRGGTGLGRDRTGGDVLRRNTPTVWNAAFNHAQFWDGRAADLEEQAALPIQDAHEMAQDSTELVRELRAIPEYAALFDEAFGGAQGPAVTFANVTHAVAAFERTLVSQNSRFDRYARGDRAALTRSERRGLGVFRSLKTRCFECHNLPTFNNPDFKVIGVPTDGEEDLGHGEVAGDGYAHAFKVPTLRNVALTAPYMHNGRFETLGEVVDFYAEGGGLAHGFDPEILDDKIRPFALSPQEKGDLIAFLHALTDTSAMPAIPRAVPSGLPVVPRLQNQSPEMAAFEEPPAQTPGAVRREGRRLVVAPGRSIQDAIDAAQPGDTVAIRPGVYHETLTLDVSGLTLLGLTEDGRRPVLDGRGRLSDGAIGSGSGLTFENLEVRNYTANGLMVNLGTDVVFRDLHLENTGLYGVYPVEVVGVLVEGCTVTGTRDAGIYVGQSRDIVVRGNTVYENVTGIEIENSLNAVVEDNDVYDNAGGVLVFMLPNNPSKLAIGTTVRGNRIVGNNHPNVGDPTAVVSRVPSGTGVLILAADETVVTDNEIRDNQSAGVAVVSLYSLFGADSAFDVDPLPERNRIYGNRMADNGLDPDPKVREAGFDGADLLWDLSGAGNTWDQPGASRLPYALPGPSWSDLRRRANARLWRLAAAAL